MEQAPTIVTAKQLTGLEPKTHAEITRDFFTSLQQQHPTITIDKAILHFENATNHYKTLDAFAKARARTATSYRNVYLPYWNKKIN
tara:strand:- start:196 stop:453 length:258 start_codon:yes stop_codon:yes gene_type:complete